MTTKQLIGFIMRVISPIGLGLSIGWLIRDFGSGTLWYAIGIAGFTAAILVGYYLEKN